MHGVLYACWFVVCSAHVDTHGDGSGVFGGWGVHTGGAHKKNGYFHLLCAIFSLLFYGCTNSVFLVNSVGFGNAATTAHYHQWI